jgi:hypothetical protein
MYNAAVYAQVCSMVTRRGIFSLYPRYMTQQLPRNDTCEIARLPGLPSRPTASFPFE